MGKRVIRWAFVLVQESRPELTVSGWRLWTSKNDTYITAKPLDGTWKVSLHDDEAWRFAVTSEETRSQSPVWSGQDRALWKFAPTKFVRGVRLAFAVAVFRDAYMAEVRDTRETAIHAKDRWDEVTLAKVWMSEPGVHFESSQLVGGPLALENGRQVWVTAASQEVAAIPSQPIPAAVVIRPVSPDTHPVTSPGMVLRGAQLS